MSDAPHVTGKGTNALAIVGLILAIFFPIIGAILGHVALSQIKKTGEEGRGLALAAVIVGWTLTGLAIVAVIVSFIPFLVLGGMML
jgi:peptidyl-prolyl cis-trans isomerase B (cyclophilin B)